MDYDRFRSLTNRLLTNFGNGGEAVFYRQAASANFDPLTGTETIPNPTTHRALVVVPGTSDRSREEARVSGWDVRFIINATGFEPQPGDLVELPGSSQRYVVMAPIERKAPDGVPIAYVVIARRGEG